MASIELFYQLMMVVLGIFCVVMLRLLYNHLEHPENRELFVMDIGLLLDILGSFYLVHASSVDIAILCYQFSFLGRFVFAWGFISYVGRMYHSKHKNFVLIIWGGVSVASFFCTFFHDADNPFLSNVSLAQINGISMIIGSKGVMYYAHISVVVLVGLWCLVLVAMEDIKSRKRPDQLQSILGAFFIIAVLFQGVGSFLHEYYYGSFPDMTALFKGVAGVIFSILAIKYQFTSYDFLARDALFDSIGAGFVIMTNDYRILFTNEIAKDVFPDLKSVRGLLPYSAELKDAVGMREYEKFINGNTYRITADRIYQKKNRLAGYTVLIINISDVVQLENEAAEARQSKSTLLTNMAHELRTPLNALTGTSEMLLSADNLNDAKDYAAVIKKAVASLNQNFSSMITVFEDEDSLENIENQPYDIPTLIENVVGSAKERARRLRIDFDVEVSPNLPIHARGDVGRIRKSLTNVLYNAIRYTEDGHVFFKIYGSLSKDGRFSYVYEIRDTGRNVVFSNDTEDKDNPEGNVNKDNAGRGLVLAKRSVESMGGSFSAEYAEGVNIFKITIRQEIADSFTLGDYRIGEKISFFFVGGDEKYWEPLKEACYRMFVKGTYIDDPKKLNDYVAPDNRALVLLTQYGRYTKKKSDYAKLYDFYKVVVANSSDSMDTPVGDLLVDDSFSTLTIRQIFLSRERAAKNDNSTVPFLAPSATVLVVDDTPLNRTVTLNLLAKFKIEGEAVESGYECLDKLKSGKQYDLILMDYMMEGIDGIETTRRIRGLDRYGRYVPIIAFTANDVEGVKEKYIAAGMNDCLFKPIYVESLGKILKSFLPQDKIMPNEEALDSEGSESGDSSGKADGFLGASIVVEGFERLSEEGINVNEALRFISGNIEVYKEMLGEFSAEIYTKAQRINECFQKNDYHTFTILVHGVKSASKLLGIASLSEKMADMEMAGNREDAEYIKKNINSVLAAYRHYETVLHPYYEESQSTSMARRSTDRLSALLDTIKSALEEFEMSEAENLLSALKKEKVSSDEAEVVEELENAIITLDYYSSLDSVNKLLEMHEKKLKK